MILSLFFLGLLNTFQSKVLNQIGRIYLENVGKDAVENAVVDAENKRIFVGSDYATGIDVLSFDTLPNLSSMTIKEETFISFKSIVSKKWFRDRSINKITIDDVPATVLSPNGYVIALAEPKWYSYYTGFMVFINRKSLEIENVIQLNNCYAPSHMEITNNGNTLIVCCEGNPTKKQYSFTNTYEIPPGIVKLLDISSINNIKQYDITFDKFNYLFDDNKYQFGYDIDGNEHSSIYRPFNHVPLAQNAEPEFVTLSNDDKYAFISLQDMNAIAVIQLNNNIEYSKVINIYGLGFHSINVYDDSPESYGMDVSDKDGFINIVKHPNLYALKQPDSIKYFTQNGKHYILTANEGSEKNFDESRVYNLKLNATNFPGFDIDNLQRKSNLGRLQVTNLYGYDYPSNNIIKNVKDIQNNINNVKDNKNDKNNKDTKGKQGKKGGKNNNKGKSGKGKPDKKNNKPKPKPNDPVSHNNKPNKKDNNGKGYKINNDINAEPDNVALKKPEKLYNTLYVFGSRNFDIFEWDPVKDTFTSIYNSRDDFEQITADILGTAGFNSHNKRQPSSDQASDNQGPEPESIEYHKCKNGNEYAFIGLEKVSGIFTYQIGTNINPKYLDYTSNRNFSIPYSSYERPSINVGDIEPSHMQIINEKYFGKALLIVSNEDSSSLTVYTIDCNENTNNINIDTLNNNGNNNENNVVDDDNTNEIQLSVYHGKKIQWYAGTAVIVGIILLCGIMSYVFCKWCTKRGYKTVKDAKESKTNAQMLVQVM